MPTGKMHAESMQGLKHATSREALPTPKRKFAGSKINRINRINMINSATHDPRCMH
jgi:hypothetical protein